jgi:hypothetical protein
MPIVVPKCFDGTISSHQQVYENVLSTLQTTAVEKLRDVPSGGYMIVTHDVFKTLWQCINAYASLHRDAVYKTKFFLKGKEPEYRRQVKIKP